MQLRGFFIIQFIFFSSIILAQSSAYPKYYFRNPLGIPIELTANFGELRSDHWHMGLDIRTDQKENLPVYASAEGYIAHAGVRSQSFGRYIIINHPNGYSTLYAHLNDFFPPLEKFVQEQQYHQESWEIELDLSKEQFPVFKSQFIAYSGNTGGSQGPHLHFEIRNTKTGKCLNPLLFGLPLKDDMPPSFVKLAMYNRNKSMYDQTPELFPVKNTSSGYILSQTPVIKTGSSNLSFAIQAFDRVTGSNNPNGISSARLFLDEEPFAGFTLDSIGYNETLYINAHIDYKYRFDGGVYLQQLTALPGDNGIAYRKIKDEGTILLQDTFVHNVRIEIKDAYFNTAQLKFGIQYNDSLARSSSNSNSNPGVQRFVPNNVNVVEKPEFEMYLPENSLYDTITAYYFRTNSATPFSVSAMHQLNDASFPLHEDMTIRIKPDKP
ncbi:MAG: M23 family metallopeptidase, partial [Bacteroidota bacterium]